MMLHHGNLPVSRKKHSVNSEEYRALIKLKHDTVDTVKRVVVAGIGGSNLGVKAITHIFKLPIIFLETYSDTHTPRAGDILVVITKSGSTTETLHHYAKADKYDTVHVITTAGNKLYRHAKKKGYRVSSIPKKVGGRYSVFTNVGSIPLSYAGFDVTGFMRGVKQMVSMCQNMHLAAKIAGYSAMDVIDTFVFHKDYETLGKWNRQLIAESLGKKGKGYLPTVSVGTVDLHSMLQYYLDGKLSIVTQFIRTPDSHHDTLDAITQNYSEKQKLWYEVGLDRTPFDTGAYMMFMVHYVLELGNKLKVNPYNQPAVERYKEIMR